MKFLLVSTTLLLASCSMVKDIYGLSSESNCYGLGNAQCVKDGYRTDQVMRPEMRVDDLQHLKKP